MRLLTISLLILPWLFCSGLLAAEESGVSSRPVIPVVKVEDVINPVLADFLLSELEWAETQGAEAFLLELDTPGGLDSAMRQIIKGVLGSELPVIVYVYPPGARAASAGALITLAADFAAMAPGTNIGAATPVGIGPGGGGDDEVMMEKVVQDAVAYARSIAQERGRNVDWAERIVRESVSTPAREALELGVIDLMAESEDELLASLNGRSYKRGAEERTLQTAGAQLVERRMNWRQQILNTISNPNVAYLLLMLGLLGIFFEISQPGVILPGAVGAIALVLAFFAFQTLPVNYAGVLLILLAGVLFILEITVPSYGMLTVGGVVALAFGSLMLIEGSSPYVQISRAVIAATVSVCSLFFILVVYFVTRTQSRPPFSGLEALVGEKGEAVADFEEQGRVFVHGEYWNATAAEPVKQGQAVEVLRVLENMRLEVRPLSSTRKE